MHQSGNNILKVWLPSIERHVVAKTTEFIIMHGTFLFLHCFPISRRRLFCIPTGELRLNPLKQLSGRPSYWGRGKYRAIQSSFKKPSGHEFYEFSPHLFRILKKVFFKKKPQFFLRFASNLKIKSNFKNFYKIMFRLEGLLWNIPPPTNRVWTNLGVVISCPKWYWDQRLLCYSVSP